MKKILQTLFIVIAMINIGNAQIQNLDLVKDINVGSGNAFPYWNNQHFKLNNKAYINATNIGENEIYELTNFDTVRYVCKSDTAYNGIWYYLNNEYSSTTIHNNKYYQEGSNSRLYEFDGISSNLVLEPDRLYDMISFDNKLLLSIHSNTTSQYGIYDYNNGSLIQLYNQISSNTFSIFNNELYFAISDELIKYDGTVFTQVDSGSYQSNIIDLNNTLTTTGKDSLGVFSIFKYTGTTKSVYNFPEEYNAFTVQKVEIINNYEYLVVKDTTYTKTSLFRFDGNNIELVIENVGEEKVDLYYNSLDERIYVAPRVSNAYYYSIYSVDLLNNLAIDTIAEGVFGLLDIALKDNDVYFGGTLNNIPEGKSIYKYNINSHNTVKVASRETIYNLPVSNLQLHNNNLYCTASDGVYGNELYMLNETCEYKYSTETVATCNSYTWINGTTYTESIDTIHTFHNYNGSGCDSTVSLFLTISGMASTTTANVCDTYTWIDGNTYTANNNTATFTYTNANGTSCDSVVTLNLTVSNMASTQTITACDTYSWIDGNTYTVSDSTTTFTISNANGTSCDSIVTLDLTVYNITAVASQNGNSIEMNSTFDSYQWSDVNGVISGATTQTFTPTTNGDYSCEVTQNQCSKTSNTVSYASTGIKEMSIDFSIHPNPTTGIFNIAVKEKLTSIILIDITGKQIKSFDSKATQLDVSDVSSGIYFLEVANDNKKSVVKLSIKN